MAAPRRRIADSGLLVLVNFHLGCSRSWLFGTLRGPGLLRYRLQAESGRAQTNDCSSVPAANDDLARADLDILDDTEVAWGSSEESDVVNGLPTARRDVRERRCSVHGTERVRLAARKADGSRPEFESSRLGLAIPGRRGDSPILIPDHNPREISSREAVPHDEIVPRVLRGDEAEFPLGVEQQARD